MSLVADQVRRRDAYLDRLPIFRPQSWSEEGSADVDEHGFTTVAAADALVTPRVDHLLRIIQSLSTTSTQPLLSAQRVRDLLLQSGIPSEHLHAKGDKDAAQRQVDARTFYENEIKWLLVTKATVHLYGVVLNSLLDRIIPLSDDIWYWSEVLSSHTYSSLYAAQTSPLRFWAWSQDVYRSTRTRMRSVDLRSAPSDLVDSTATGLTQQWSRFYGIVRDSIRERSLANIQRRVLSPVAFCRSEARRKQGQLRKLKEMTASGLGVLMYEGLQFGQESEKAEAGDPGDLKSTVERSIALMNVVLWEVCNLRSDMDEFEDKVFTGVAEDPAVSGHMFETTAMDRPAILARRLLALIDKALPQHAAAMQSLTRANGRPPVAVRYWLPAVVGLLSSTTVLRVLVNRKADIVDWIADFGQTVRDFWFNWIVLPVQKVIKTIRHDEASEIAIMSRDSLRADRESLERMVVDFAMDKPHFADGSSSLSAAQVAAIRAKVAEGDVTPVLRAFEKDLKSPLVGAVRGDLVRSLLIQVQKTKVDLEVAMTGIDSLLKSQELVFGFVGLTPGVLVSIGVLRYLGSLLGGRSGQRRTSTAGRAVRILRNVDRILSEARPAQGNVLPYKDHGLLLFEVHVLREVVGKLMPRDIRRDFLDDLDDLANMKGILVQSKALERIRWAYARWLN
ncbi:ATP synthase regulation protein NCA2 [Drechmeria coniospora]|uniref:ATP synthase regulation protein NCA2 n=1 Tax=Drechmeria coniospora TaxID=98403 RepID=A0A151GQV5_DRECN|nr:ATP synthase regulation protein NCA2 [Drechmeria coniospora]KYK59473.1 ATP synthase regulation protein NCA2 [Drechmeria coniospora]ODA76284.1 hypothetical protein RJ55_08129 [Drechmeria coniospora]